MGLTKSEKHNRMMEKVFRGVEAIDKKARCPKCKKPIKRTRGLGTLTEVCLHCGYTNVEGRK
jgi:ribosomal protein L37AE/L43A